MSRTIREVIHSYSDKNEKLKKKLKEVTEAMVQLAYIAGYKDSINVPWASLAEEARQLYEETK